MVQTSSENHGWKRNYGKRKRSKVVWLLQEIKAHLRNMLEIDGRPQWGNKGRRYSKSNKVLNNCKYNMHWLIWILQLLGTCHSQKNRLIFYIISWENLKCLHLRVLLHNLDHMVRPIKSVQFLIPTLGFLILELVIIWVKNLILLYPTIHVLGKRFRLLMVVLFL